MADIKLRAFISFSSYYTHWSEPGQDGALWQSAWYSPIIWAAGMLISWWNTIQEWLVIGKRVFCVNFNFMHREFLCILTINCPGMVWVKGLLLFSMNFSTRIPQCFHMIVSDYVLMSLVYIGGLYLFFYIWTFLYLV